MMRAQRLNRQFTDWVSSLDSRPREKQAAIGTAIVGGLFAWFAIALGSPLLLVAIPTLGGLFYGGVRTERRLHPVDDDPFDVSYERVAPVAQAVSPSPAPAQAPAPPPVHAEPEEDEPSDNLLSRISLAPPPPPVGRSSASYIYEPEPVTELVDLPEDDEPEETQETGERFYEVLESVDGRSVVRHSSPSLFGATDYALELHARSRGTEIQVVRVRGDVRENVLRFSRDRPPEGSDSAKSLLDLFGYPVTSWKGPA